MANDNKIKFSQDIMNIIKPLEWEYHPYAGTHYSQGAASYSIIPKVGGRFDVFVSGKLLGKFKTLDGAKEKANINWKYCIIPMLNIPESEAN